MAFDPDDPRFPVVTETWAHCEKCNRDSKHKRVVYPDAEYWTCPCGCKTTREPDRTADHGLRVTSTTKPNKTKKYLDFKRNCVRHYRKQKNESDWSDDE